jgi:hypothetical protein
MESPVNPGRFNFLLSKRLRRGLFICIKEIVEKRRTRWIALVGVTSIVLAVVAVWIPVAENGDDVLRYRGEPIVTNHVSQKYASVYWEPGGEQIGRIGLTWSPLKSLYDNLPGASDRLENGHDYRYVGMVTAVFGFAGLFFARNVSLVASLLATFLFVNGFLIYTTENIFFEFLWSHSEVISSIRNTQTILPRGGSSIMLILLAVLGIDAMFRKDRRARVHTVRGILFSGIIGFSFLVLAIVLYFRVFDPVNKGFLIDSGIHIAIYGLLFAIAGMGLLFAVRRSHKTAWVGAILILVIFDGVTSLSSRMGGELSSGNVWPHQWDARIPYNELERRGMILQDDLKFNAFVKASDAMFPITYRSGAYHNSTEINSARREWLEVYGMDSDRRILLNWNDSTNSVERYPYFLTARDACVLPDDSTLQQVASMAKNRILIKESSDVSMPNGNCTSSVLKPTIEELTFNRVALETSQPEASFLMFVDNSDRFWTAEVNGEKAEIVEANILYKGVHLPKGKNTVVWNYDPWPIRYIRYAALLGLSVFGLVLLLEHRRRGENALKAL